MKLYKTKKNCGKLLLGILAFCTGMILLTGCGSSSEQKQNKNEETWETIVKVSAPFCDDRFCNGLF